MIPSAHRGRLEPVKQTVGLRVVLPHASLAVLSTLIGLSFSWTDAIVLAGAAFAVQGLGRRLWAAGAVCLFTLSFPPWSWPTCWFCLAPLVWIWRQSEPRQSMARVVLEAVGVGFAMCWLSTGFVRSAIPAWGCVFHSVACVIFSLQVVPIALAIRVLRDRPLIVAAPLTAVAAVACEALQAWCGLVWSVTSLSLPLAATPVAQWARWITPLGVAGLAYTMNFLILPDRQATTKRLRWIGSLTALGIGAAAWLGGNLIADATHISPMPFSTMLVQPHLKGEKQVPWRPWIKLDRLTQTSLDREGPVDLIVWPESSLSTSPLDDPTGEAGDGTLAFERRLTVAGFSETLLPRYGTNCLVGVAMWRRAVETRYGLQVPMVRRYNCGCLVQSSGEASCYEKQVLVPFREGLPGWLEETPWIRSHFLPFFQLKGELTPSRRFRLLAFRDRHNQERTIAVSICYEAFLFWLPQYRDSSDVEAIVHLVYDGVWHNHREVIERQILACRYRAIETRTWNLVCSTWAGTAIIDPAGRVAAQIPAEPAVLRSDLIDRSVTCGTIQSGKKTPLRDCVFRDGG